MVGIEIAFMWYLMNVIFIFCFASGIELFVMSLDNDEEIHSFVVLHPWKKEVRVLFSI